MKNPLKELFFKVKVTVRRGSNYRSDIALDDLKILHCSEYHCLISINFQFKKQNNPLKMQILI